MPDDRGGDDRHPVARAPHPQAQVDVVADQRERGVEAADVVPDVTAHEHPRGGDSQHVAAVVVLTLIQLTLGDVVDAPSAVGHGDADLHESPGIVPAPLLAPGDRDRR